MMSTHYKIYLRDRDFVPNTFTPLQTTLTAEAHLAEGQFLLEEQTLNLEIIQFNSYLCAC
jgi:hypothetical protein